MLVRDWPTGLSLQEIDLKMSIFWVQIHGLPLEYMTTANAERRARKLGNFIQVEQATDMKVILRKYMRVQVEINVENPLPDGFPLSRPRKQATWISFTYERLSKFCYCCGCLCHIQQVCPLFQVKTEVSNFGPWMRAETVRWGAT